MIFLVIMALAVMAVIFCVVDKSRLRLWVAGMYLGPVSYTHLDVYKRQHYGYYETNHE